MSRLLALVPLLLLAACASAPARSGFLSSYDGLTPRSDTVRAKVEQRWPQNDKRAYLASLDAIIGWGVRERLAAITCPTLVISGDRDYTPVSLKQAYVGQMPNARLVVIEDSRHATPLDQPERFNTTLLDFIDQVDHP